MDRRNWQLANEHQHEIREWAARERLAHSAHEDTNAIEGRLCKKTIGARRARSAAILAAAAAAGVALLLTLGNASQILAFLISSR